MFFIAGACVPKPPVGSLALHGFLRRIMRPDLTRTTTVRPAEEPRLPRATYRAPISRGPEHLTPHTTHITHHFRRPGAPYHAYHAYHAPFPSAPEHPYHAYNAYHATFPSSQGPP